MNIFTYRASDQFANIGLIVKDGLDRPSVFLDFSDGCINSAVTVSTVSAIAVSSTNSTITTQVVGTTAVSNQVARIDLKTCGASGTSAAVDGDRMKMTVTAALSSGGPLLFDVFIDITAPTYGPV